VRLKRVIEHVMRDVAKEERAVLHRALASMQKVSCVSVREVVSECE